MSVADRFVEARLLSKHGYYTKIAPCGEAFGRGELRRLHAMAKRRGEKLYVMPASDAPPPDVDASFSRVIGHTAVEEWFRDPCACSHANLLQLGLHADVPVAVYARALAKCKAKEGADPGLHTVGQRAVFAAMLRAIEEEGVQCHSIVTHLQEGGSAGDLARAERVLMRRYPYFACELHRQFADRK